ncbi:MAG: hypothetical protein IT287_02585 [Bdellovibrionaceae bacterium]|nr:hypothetical protein [Pseudobdellovibrionaceae bacterium]
MRTDIFFLSYMESNADKNWAQLIKKYPKAQRIHGVKGVKAAHKKIAEASNTDFFFVIDGDNSIMADFDFAIPTDLDVETLYVWRAQNPVNDLCYGFGGIKLYNKWLLLKNTRATSVDIATSIAPKYVPVPIVASTTEFNASALESWRGAFRESAKLTLNTCKNPMDSVSHLRLETWKTKGQNRLFGAECVTGANMGHAYVILNAKSATALDKINDFEWLNSLFHSQN